MIERELEEAAHELHGIAAETKSFLNDMNVEFDKVAEPASRSVTLTLTIVAILLLYWWGVTYVVFPHPAVKRPMDVVPLAVFCAPLLLFFSRLIQKWRARIVDHRTC